MKRLLIALIGIGMLTFVAFTGTTQAKNVEAANVVSVAKGEVVDSTFYAAGNTVTIDGTVQGDVFCAANTVTITGTVEGDVICAGQQVSVTGKVLGDIRVAGQSVNVGGEVGTSATVFGQAVVVDRNASIAGDLTVGGNSLTLAGAVGRDVLGGASDTAISGMVGRNVTLETETATLQDGTKIGGDFVYTSKQKASISGDAVVAGKTTQKQPEVVVQEQRQTANGAVMGGFYWFATMFVVGLVLWLLLPRWVNGTADTMTRKPWAALGLGLATLILTPIVSITLLFTVFGIPLALGLIVLWLFALLGSFVLAAHSAGRWAMHKLGKASRGFEVLGLVAGIVVLVVVGSLPLVGGLAVFLALLWGMGGITLSVFGTLRAQQTKTPAKKKA